MKKPGEVTIKLTWHQLEAIVVQELQEAIERLFILEKDEKGNLIPLDDKYVDAFLLVLEKYMGMEDHKQYANEIKNRKPK